MASQNSQPATDVATRPPDEPEIHQSWVSEAPLKLVGSALCAMPGHSGKFGDIQKALDAWGLKPTTSWAGWWKKVRPMLADSEHFAEEKSSQFKVLHEVADIPPEPLPDTPSKAKTPRAKSPSKTEMAWLNWFRGEVTSPPSQAPTKAAFQAFDNYPVEPVQPALERALSTAQDFLASDKGAKQHAGGWAELLCRLSGRWRNLPESYIYAYGLARPVGETMGRLIETANFPNDSGWWLRQAGGLPDEPPGTWRAEFAAGLWQAFANSSSGARHCFQSCFGRSTWDKPAIAQVLLAAAFAENNSPIHHTKLDGMLETLPPETRPEVIQYLVLQSASGKVPKDRVHDYIGSTYHIPKSSSAQGLRLLVLATLLLTDGQGDIADRASRRMSEALADSSIGIEDPTFSTLLSAVRQQIADLQKSHAHEMESRRQSYKGALAERLGEEERLNRMVQSLRAEIAAEREVSRMDILQDVLTVITETLQSLRQATDSPAQMTRRVEANLALALNAAGAEEFGAIDDIVPYDPTRHRSEEYIESGSPVRIALPGALIPGKLAGDRVLIKANVIGHTEVK